MPSFVDQLGREVIIPGTPSRIISVVPSQTELLADLGLDATVVAITRFCIHPERWFHSKTRVGGTKKLNLDRIQSLQPDLILANKEENTRSDIEKLSSQFPVWISDIHDLSSAKDMIEQVGQLTSTTATANDITFRIDQRFGELSRPQHRLRVAYFIWKDPYMVAGGDTFIHDMIQHAGFENAFADQARYPAPSADDIRARKPDILFLSSEPFPFSSKHFKDMDADLPDIPRLLVDGELFSWYGSRLLQSPAYFETLGPQALSLIHGAGIR